MPNGFLPGTRQALLGLVQQRQFEQSPSGQLQQLQLEQQRMEMQRRNALMEQLGQAQTIDEVVNLLKPTQPGLWLERKQQQMIQESARKALVARGIAPETVTPSVAPEALGAAVTAQAQLSAKEPFAVSAEQRAITGEKQLIGARTAGQIKAIQEQEKGAMARLTVSEQGQLERLMTKAGYDIALIRESTTEKIREAQGLLPIQEKLIETEAQQKVWVEKELVPLKEKLIEIETDADVRKGKALLAEETIQSILKAEGLLPIQKELLIEETKQDVIKSEALTDDEKELIKERLKARLEELKAQAKYGLIELEKKGEIAERADIAAFERAQVAQEEAFKKEMELINTKEQYRKANAGLQLTDMDKTILSEIGKSQVKLSRINPILDNVKQQFLDLKPGEGAGGKLSAFASKYFGAAGITDPRFATYDSFVKGISIQIAKALGEVGNIALNERKQAERLLPKAGDTKKQGLQKIKRLRSLVDSLQSNNVKQMKEILDKENISYKELTGDRQTFKQFDREFNMTDLTTEATVTKTAPETQDEFMAGVDQQLNDFIAKWGFE